DQAFLSKELATIKCDVELPQSLGELHSTTTDTDALLALYQSMEFNAWIAEFSEASCIPPEAISSESRPSSASAEQPLATA
ncbi:hypothetical protein Q4595_30025, partial [Wenyingzhuangia sp. 1_MG-2023]|nr:hypothetical protein [Wenyingzhuangia sp. 1_MG-2023]